MPLKKMRRMRLRMLKEIKRRLTSCDVKLRAVFQKVLRWKINIHSLFMGENAMPWLPWTKTFDRLLKGIRNWEVGKATEDLLKYRVSFC